MVRWLALAMCLTGCFDEVDPRWQLDHDHIVAVRATPPRILPGEIAKLDALVAHEGEPTTVETPSEAAVLSAPAVIKDWVFPDKGAWWVQAPPEESLVLARQELGLAPGAPIALEVYTAFTRPDGEPLYARKTVWLGATGANPDMPEVSIDGHPMADEVVVPRETDVYLSVEARDTWRVSWLSSCGTLFQDDVATSFLRVLPDDRAEGQLAVVIRDDQGGVAWDVWSIRADAVAAD